MRNLTSLIRLLVCDTGQGGYHAPYDHAAREVYGRLPDPVQKHVPSQTCEHRRELWRVGSLRGYLHENISDIENTEKRVELLAFEAKILLEPAQTRRTAMVIRISCTASPVNSIYLRGIVAVNLANGQA